jgi:diguanylate cyclase (GGDEF)-like protein
MAGGEFLLLLPGCGPESGRMIADRVRERIQAVTTLYGALTLSVTASFGLASTSVAAMEPSSQIEAADSALYRAKSNGRNRVEESLPGTRERSATQSLRDSAHRS